MRFASLLHPAKHIQDDADPRQQSTPFPKIARVAICTLLAASLTAAGAPSALAQDDATQQAVAKSEGAAESHSGQSQQMPAPKPEPEPAQPVEPENEPVAPADDAAPGALDGDTGTDAIVGEGASSAATENSPAANDGAEGSTASGIPADNHTPPLDANAEPLSEEEVEDGETEEDEDEPEAQTETRAGEVTDWDQFIAAVNEANQSGEPTTINVRGEDSLFDSTYRIVNSDKCNPVAITGNITITSSNSAEIWYTPFVVENGGTLTLEGNIFINGDVVAYPTIDTITIKTGGTLKVQGRAQILADNGTGASSHKPPEGIAVVIDGGNATINTSSRIEGSSGGLLISENGGTCTVYSGTFATEAKITESGWTDFGHAAIDNINGKLTLQGNGSNIRIDSLENSGTLFATGAAFEEVYFRNDSGNTNGNPIFNNQDTTGDESTSGGAEHTGTAWIYDCSFTKPNDGSKGIYSEGPTYVYAPTENEGLKIGGTRYRVEAPQIGWSEDAFIFSASNNAPHNSSNRRYLGSSASIGSFADLQSSIESGFNSNSIANVEDLSTGQPVTPNDCTDMPYAAAAFDFPVDGGDVLHVFGPTSELNIMSVDVRWGDMAFAIYPSTNDWNPAAHAYEQLSIEPVNNIRPADGEPKGNEVWITNARSTRPIAATFDFTPEGQYKDVFSPISWYDYYDGGQLSLANYEEGYPLSLNKQPLVFSLNFDFSSEDTLVYSLNHSKIGTATVTIGYAS